MRIQRERLTSDERPTKISGGQPQAAHSGLGLIRRRVGLAAFVAVLVASAAAAPSATARQAARSHASSRSLRTSVKVAGKYEIVVWVRARGKHERTVEVYLTGQRRRIVVANPWWGARLYYRLSLNPSTVTVRTLNPAPAVQIRAVVTLRRAAASSSKTQPAPTLAGPTTKTAATTPPATPSSNTPPPAPPAPPPAPPAPPAPPVANDPYTNLLWEDNFAQDFVNGGSVPNQLPNTSNWSLDSWGGCGPGTLSTTTPSGNPGADKNAYLTANGLAITALQTGPYSYTSAQLDSIGSQSAPKSFQTGGSIEASISLPAGQGLCPGFWMLADNPLPGATTPGEIDILEAPSFGPLPTAAMLTLHGPTGAQEFESAATPAGWTPTQFHTYGLIWTPTSITWTIDSVAYATATASSVPAGSWPAYETGAFRLIFDLAVGGWPCNDTSCTPPPSSTMYIQWVKVFD